MVVAGALLGGDAGTATRMRGSWETGRQKTATLAWCVYICKTVTVFLTSSGLAWLVPLRGTWILASMGTIALVVPQYDVVGHGIIRHSLISEYNKQNAEFLFQYTFR